MPFALFLFLLVTIFAPDFSHGEASELILEDFDRKVASQPTLIMFGSPKCGICKAWAPAFNEAADMLVSGVLLAKVDCSQETALCKKHGIQNYPHLKVYGPGLPETGEDFMGNRDLRGYTEWMESQSSLVRCSPSNGGAGCDEKQRAFLEKWIGVDKPLVKGELNRLESLSTSGAMKADLKKWLKQRIAILSEIVQCEADTCRV